MLRKFSPCEFPYSSKEALCIHHLDEYLICVAKSWRNRLKLILTMGSKKTKLTREQRPEVKLS